MEPQPGVRPRPDSLRNYIRRGLLDPKLASCLCEILKLRTLPPRLERHLTERLGTFALLERARGYLEFHRSRTSDLIQGTRRLRDKISRTSRANAIEEPYEILFDRLAWQIDEMFQDLEEMGCTPAQQMAELEGPRMRRWRLRIMTMRALERFAGLKINKSASSPAAKAVAEVLNEADRLVGPPGSQPKWRHNISGTQWATWVEEYRQSTQDLERRRATRVRAGNR